MKHILLTTALVAFTSGSALAEAHKAGNTMLLVVDSQYQTEQNMSITASNLMGKTVYMSDPDSGSNIDLTDLTEVPDTWQNVADVSDILIDRDGKLASIVLDAGGFLGMGETQKNVTIDNLKFVADKDDDGEYFVVYTGDKQLLEDSDNYDAAAMQDQGYQSADRMNADSDGMQSADQTNVTGEMQPLDRSAMTKASLANMTTEDLEGVSIYGANDNMVGEIGEMVLAEGGKISDVIVDIGGFLGIGERHVAVQFDKIELMQDNNGLLTGYISMSEEELENLPEWEGNT